MHPLLLECCRPRPNYTEIHRLSAASQDWTALAGVATSYRLAPLFFWGLQHACTDLVPPGVLAELRRHFDEHTRKHLLFSADLHRILDFLRAGGIQAIPFKGAALAWSIYLVPGLRPMSDVDLFISEHDLRAAIRLFEENGYKRQFSGVDIRFLSGAVNLAQPNGATKIDLHWRLAPDYFRAVDSAAFLSRTVQLDIGGRPAAGFCPEDSLILLCAHGGKHGWRSPLWICDVARLIDASPLDWDSIFSRAEENDMSRVILLGVYLAENLFGAKAPLEVSNRATRDGAIPRLGSWAQEILERDSQPRIIELLRFRQSILESSRDRLRLLRSYLSPRPADWYRFHIPVGLFPLYYLAKPVRLAGKWRRRLYSKRA